MAIAALLIALSGAAVAASPAMFQSSPDGGCVEWRACRQLALAAAERGEYGTFHDLAWRAVQTGPPKDPALMYLLARAQALSGRPHDALIMLQRLAEMGVASDAATNEDFKDVRQLRDWTAVEPRIAAAGGVAPPSATPPSTPPPSPPSTPPPTPPSPPPSKPSPAVGLAVVAPVPANQGVRFSTKQFAVSGLAYDAPSRRFVLGDRLGRKLIVVDERSSHTMDLVRADSAGFLDISAVEIDAKRGDLWVASGAPADGAGTLHRLQLVSGRPLRAFQVGVDLAPVTLVDLAVVPSGAILVLDSLTPQLLVLRAGGTALERVVRIDAPEPASVAARADDGMAFVAHRDGVSRIDLRARTVSPVAAPKGVSLGHLERIRWRRNALIAVQVDDDGSRRIVRLEMNARGSSITRVIKLEVPAPAAGQTFVTISGDELVYLRAGANDAAGRSSSDAVSDQADAIFVASRTPLP
jgi:hypothetical protein